MRPMYWEIAHSYSVLYYVCYFLTDGHLSELSHTYSSTLLINCKVESGFVNENAYGTMKFEKKTRCPFNVHVLLLRSTARNARVLWC